MHPKNSEAAGKARKATQQAAFDMLKKLKNLDMSKVKGFSISVMLGDKDEDEDEDYHMMPDGSKMEGKEHPKKDNLPPKEDDEEVVEDREEVEKDEDYEEKKKLRIR